MTDPRETEHIECDCVPHLGPPHCHLCSTRVGHEVTWPDCATQTTTPPAATPATRED